MSLTLGDFIDNMEKNGFPKIKHSLYFESDIQKGGCALGQACFNTFNKMISIHHVIFNDICEIRSDDGSIRFYHFIINLNDNTNMTIMEIAQAARKAFLNSLGRVLIIS